jgi:hypothetical protein
MEVFIMRNVKVLRVYNLVNSKGAKLQLKLGVLQNQRSEICFPNADQGFRWSFEGDNIPMPVRSRTWFNGFPENIMLDWLKANGWVVRTIVNPCDGSAVVFDLPKVDEKPSEMETLGTDQFPALSEYDKTVFEHVIRGLVGDGHKARACRIYRYAHGGKLSDALKAVEFIITK